ncbi:UDP-glucose 4-epimerase [Thiocapsa rosea]|uniref:UDP-glucose 4-epimerase n=1 Tax=Thiocapsa rosea TaxID=69360 RepID=A0A495V787_9GAMM|nr:UDP-glucose 4-epimerase [Thiocapsa rosea]
MIGRGLIEDLERRREIEVTATSREPVHGEDQVRWVQADLTRLEECVQLVEGQDAIVHLAQPAVPLTSDGDLASEVHSNLVPALNLIAAIRIAGTCPRFVFPSSGGAVYGRGQERPFREDDRCEPANSYGLLKLTVEHYLRLASEHSQLSVVNLRIANAYGIPLPPARLQGLIGTAVSRVLEGLPVRMIGNPENVRDYVHIDDISDAVYRALSLDTACSTFNIGDGLGVSVREVIDLIEAAWGKPIERVVEAHPNAVWLPSRNVLDITLARERLGWSPQVALTEGIRRMLFGLPRA